jgi:hypothetical protein
MKHKALSGPLRGLVRRVRPNTERAAKAITLPAIGRASRLQGYLAIVLIVKDEGSYLAEWLEFHRMVGVDHVYIYDNGSTDDTAQVLQPYLQSGFVTRIPWATYDRLGRVQYQAFAHALANFGPLWRWLAFIDADEFLFPMRGDSLKSVLDAYEDLPGVAVQWHMFGTSGHKRRPRGLVIESYLERAPIPFPTREGNRLSKWKCIVDPTQVKAIGSPHLFVLIDGREGSYDEDRQWIAKDDLPTAASKILRLNHYCTKSEEELATKVAKGSAAKAARDGQPKIGAMRRAEVLATRTVKDDAILRFVPKLRERLANLSLQQAAETAEKLAATERAKSWS